MAVPDRLRGFFGSRRAVAGVALVCIALMLISVNVIAARLVAWRLDLTREHLYTLSRGTQRTLARIEEPVTLRFYYSTRLADEVPSYGVYAQRVRELVVEGEQDHAQGATGRRSGQIEVPVGDG